MSGAAPCRACGAPLASPLGCTACGALLAPEREPTPFEVFGLEPGFALDRDALQKRLRRLSRVLHPDYFGAAAEDQRALAERNTARLNQAHDVLADEAARADWLVRSLGGPGENDQREMPTSFLTEVLEWNEALESARGAAPGAPERAGLGALETDLLTQRRSALDALGRLLSPLPAHGAPALREARAQLNALRYLDNALAQIRALALPAAR